jgi:hypothetical protein
MVFIGEFAFEPPSIQALCQENRPPEIARSREQGVTEPSQNADLGFVLVASVSKR